MLHLAIAGSASAAIFPSLLNARPRAERALSPVVAQCYVDGVLTRKVEDGAAHLGAASLPCSQVSQMAAELGAWRTHLLKDGPYPTHASAAKVPRLGATVLLRLII